MGKGGADCIFRKLIFGHYEPNFGHRVKCISNLAYLGKWFIYFQFAYLGKVAYFSVSL